LKIVRKTGSSNDILQHAIGCEWLHINITGSQLRIYSTAGEGRELRVEYLAACNRKPPWSTKAFARTGRDIEQHDVVSSRISVDEFRDKGPQEWTNQALNTLEKATELYMVEVIAESSF